jgi:hypothetical protein
MHQVLIIEMKLYFNYSSLLPQLEGGPKEYS